MQDLDLDLNLDSKQELQEEIEQVSIDDLLYDRRRLRINWQWAAVIASLIIAVAALIVAIMAMNREPNLVVDMSGASDPLKTELVAKLPEDINVRNINISSTADSVRAQIVFFPQGSIEEFAGDCRRVLDIMKQQNVVYDEISFMATDSLSNIFADLSGRFSMDITVDEIIAITYYFRVYVSEAAEDNEDIQDI
jgi:hypothetical protein